MEELFDLAKFDEYREDNRREVKAAVGGLPQSLWETYSAFANTDGGVIILGVEERPNGIWRPSGIKNVRKLLKDFWDCINNRKVVSLNLLKDENVQVYKAGDASIVVVYVPRASRSQKPIYRGADLFAGSYRRNGEGDYLCSPAQIRAMLRDQTEDSNDTKQVDFLEVSDLNNDTINSYRNMHRAFAIDHPFARLEIAEYLRNIGAAVYSKKERKWRPTVAGLLMFGNEYDIVREFPHYFLDYQEQYDPSIRWTDRFYSTSGYWSGNVFDFFLRVNSRLVAGLKTPFQMNGIYRVDETPVRKAVREALVNCLTNADYMGTRGVVIKRTINSLTLGNPGGIRVGKRQALQGGVSDPRNGTILKMFNLINIGERSGSGVPNIYNVWNDMEWEAPTINEETNPDRTILVLFFDPEMADIKGGLNEKPKGKANNISNECSKREYKAGDHKRLILSYLKEHGSIRSRDVVELLGVRPSRARVLLNEVMNEHNLIVEGRTRGRVYRISDGNVDEEETNKSGE